MFRFKIILLITGTVIAVMLWFGSQGPGTETFIKWWKILFDRGIIAALVVLAFAGFGLKVANDLFIRPYRAAKVWKEFAALHQLQFEPANGGRATGTIDGLRIDVFGGRENTYSSWLGEPKKFTWYARLPLSPPDIPTMSVLVDHRRNDKFVKSLRTLSPIGSGPLVAMDATDDGFDERFNVYGEDEPAIRNWLVPHRCRAIEESASRHEVFVHNGKLIWSSYKGPMDIHGLSEVLQSLQSVAKWLE